MIILIYFMSIYIYILVKKIAFEVRVLKQQLAPLYDQATKIWNLSIKES